MGNNSRQICEYWLDILASKELTSDFVTQLCMLLIQLIFCFLPICISGMKEFSFF